MVNTKIDIEKMLRQRDIKPTAGRILILKSMINFTRAFSLSDLEYDLESVDKSTLSRTIHLFHDHHLIHSIDDGSGSVKYSVCNPNCECSVGDLHVHFYCNNCHRTICLENLAIPRVILPDGFLPNSVNFVVKGLCNHCSKSTL